MYLYPLRLIMGPIRKAPQIFLGGPHFYPGTIFILYEKIDPGFA
jgi:hypothetical protein